MTYCLWNLYFLIIQIITNIIPKFSSFVNRNWLYNLKKKCGLSWNRMWYVYTEVQPHFVPCSQPSTVIHCPLHTLCFHASLLWPILSLLLWNPTSSFLIFTYILNLKTFLTIPAQNDISCLEINIDPIDLPVNEVALKPHFLLLPESCIDCLFYMVTSKCQSGFKSRDTRTRLPWV